MGALDIVTVRDAGDAVSEFDGSRDAGQRFKARAGAGDDHGAKVENAAENGLVDLHALDLVHVHLVGPALDESGLVDDAQVGDRDLRRPPAVPFADQQKQADDALSGRRPNARRMDGWPTDAVRAGGLPPPRPCRPRPANRRSSGSTRYGGRPLRAAGRAGRSSSESPAAKIVEPGWPHHRPAVALRDGGRSCRSTAPAPH